MARTITTQPAAVKSKVENPYKQPAFTVYHMEHSVHGGGFITFDHDLEAYSRYLGDGNYAYNQYRTYSSYSPEMMNEWAGHAYKESSSHASSSSEYGSNTCNNGYLGHQNFSSVTEYSKAAGWVYGEPGRQSYIPYGFRDVNVIVNDIYQDWAWYQQHNGSSPYIRVGRRSPHWYYTQHANGLNYFNYNNKAHSTEGAQTNNSMYGGQCYNAKTKKIVMMQIDDEGRRQPVVYSGAPDLRAYALQGHYAADISEGSGESYSAYDRNSGNLYNYFQDSANYVVGERSSNQIYSSYSGHNEARYRSQTVICDDDRIYCFTMTPHRGAVLERWNADHTYDTMLLDWNWTTSYGYEQGDRFGSRWQCSSDGEYVWFYCTAYYYGSGCYWVGIRVSDGKYIHYASQDSNHGRSLCPIGKSNMFCTHSTNKDDPGISFRIHDLNHYFNVYSEGDNYSQWDSSYSQYLLDTPGNSTGYPWIIPAQYNTSLFTTQLESTRD